VKPEGIGLVDRQPLQQTAPARNTRNTGGRAATRALAAAFVALQLAPAEAQKS
jgi:hypothetical protein